MQMFFNVPMLDIQSIGAGTGTYVRIDPQKPTASSSGPTAPAARRDRSSRKSMVGPLSLPSRKA